MKIMKQFPVKHYEYNLAFGQDGTKWAYYEIPGMEYDFRNHEEKLEIFEDELQLFKHQVSDYHFLVIPRNLDVEHVLDDYKRSIDGPMQETGRWMTDKVKTYLQNRQETSEATPCRFFLGVQLEENENVHADMDNLLRMSVTGIRNIFSGAMRPAQWVSGLESTDILQDEIKRAKTAEAQVFKQLHHAFRYVYRLNEADLRYLVEYNFSRSMQLPAIDNDWKPGIEVEGEDGTKASRPDPLELIRLTDAELDESPGRSLILRKTINGEVHTSYVAFLTMRNMPEKVHYPGCEWIYYSQSLPFPVEMSIRADYMDSELVKKRLRRKSKEIDDQIHQARRGGGKADVSVLKNEKQIRYTEDKFTRTGQPGFECSVIFCVSAKNKEAIQERIHSLKKKYNQIGIPLENPIGDQLALFYEFFPGSRKVNKDYRVTMEPGLLAGGMFGATTEIGDGQGFYFGKAMKSNREVFISPDLAAKAKWNTEFDSLSAAIIGQTGKGKTFLMNLLGYWIALSGGRTVFIDYKGDRTDFPYTLPGFTEEDVDVWTLGASNEDAGSLDPFKTVYGLGDKVEEAKSLALELLAFQTDTKTGDAEYDFIQEAVYQVADFEEDPCMQDVIDQINTKYEEEVRQNVKSEEDITVLRRLQRKLNVLQRNPLGKLMIGQKGRQARSLSLDRPIQVLQIQNLEMPTEKEMQNLTYSPGKKMSVAVMIALTGFLRQFMMSDRSIFKAVMLDEAKAVMDSQYGKKLVDMNIRYGRYYNTAMYLSTQNATDFKDDHTMANIGMKFSFSLKTDEEASDALHYYNISDTLQHRRLLKRLSRGECLFQDIFGRTAKIKVDGAFDEIKKAFDTSTKEKETGETS